MKLPELEKVLQKLSQLHSEIEVNGYSTESIENAMLDKHFYNLLTSTFVDTQYDLGESPRSMYDLSIKLAESLYTNEDGISYLIDNITNDTHLLRRSIEQSTHYTKSRNASELKLFVQSGKVPEGWKTDTGICTKCCNQLKNPFTSDIACSIVQMQKPFIASHYPIQDTSKGMVNSEYLYVNSEEKYEGEQLILRIEFTKLILELAKSQKLVE